MPPRKPKNLVVHLADSDGKIYHINDLGEAKSPRFELYDDSLDKPLQKSNNPRDFDKYILKGG